MKNHALFFLCLSLIPLSIQAQGEKIEETKDTDKGTTIGISTGLAGGSYYDIKKDFKMDKYGKERLSPTGYSFTGTLDSDKFGSVFLRQISVSRKEDGTKLGSQTLFTYDSPKFVLKEKQNMNLFLKGKVMHYAQKDHFIYFQVDDEFIPDIEKNLETQPHIRIDQHQTYIAPEIGFCLEKEYEWKDFKLEGFIEATLSPIAVLNYKSKLGENTMPTGDLSGLNKAGTILASGGQLKFEGMAKYKDKYYFKVSILQTHHAGLGSDRVSVTNRVGIYELGYNVNENLSFNASVHQNELLFSNKDRHAIDVYNIVGVGLKYKIPSKKKVAVQPD
jgi:hypothetical protein